MNSDWKESMGGKSSVTVDVMNKAITNSAMQVVNTCAASASNEFSIKVGKVAGDVVFGNEDPKKRASIKQVAETSLNCNNNTDLEAAMKSAMENNMKAQSSAQQQSLFEGSMSIYTESETNQKLRNETIMNTDLSAIQDCIQESNNVIKKEFGEIGGNFIYNQDVEQDARADMEKCVNDTRMAVDMATDYNNKLESASKTQGLAGTMFDGLGNTLASIVMIAVVLAIVGFIFFLTKRGLAQKQMNQQGR